VVGGRSSCSAARPFGMCSAGIWVGGAHTQMPTLEQHVILLSRVSVVPRKPRDTFESHKLNPRMISVSLALAASVIAQALARQKYFTPNPTQPPFCRGFFRRSHDSAAVLPLSAFARLLVLFFSGGRGTVRAPPRKKPQQVRPRPRLILWRVDSTVQAVRDLKLRNLEK